ncbi:MAG: hypothetical protein JXA33_25995 [Anaerolineae bacterium]|nr:hypothetical protein [Anaerolineae bacterium]
MEQPDVAALPSLLERFASFGEVYLNEIESTARASGQAHWLPLLMQAGWIEPLDNKSYGITGQFLALSSDLTIPERQRHICFAIPAYRRYVLAILAEGLILGSKVEGLQDTLEMWVMQLAPVAGEINILLDEIETGQGRAITWDEAAIKTRFRDMCAAAGAFDTWDRVLLGVSGTPDRLFKAVLDRAAAFVTPGESQTPSLPLALLPDFAIPVDNSGRPVLPQPAAEFTKREHIFSSVPFFTADSQPCYTHQPSADMVWQDALAEHPYYRAVLRVAIAVRMSGYDQITFALSIPEALNAVQLLIDRQSAGTLAELLPGLVTALGYTPLSQPDSLQVQRIVEHWIQVGALEVNAKTATLQLCESYARTLYERRRASRLLRGAAEQEQERVKCYLKSKKN